MPEEYGFTKEETRDGIMDKPVTDLLTMATSRGITVPTSSYHVLGTRTRISSQKEKLVYLIWEHIASNL